MANLNVQKNRGSVRMGPISIFVLIIVLCLAVLSVLAVTTAHAERAITDQQSVSVTGLYRNETDAQEFVAGLADALGKVRHDGGTIAQGRQAVQSYIDDYNDRKGNPGALDSAVASMGDDQVTAVFAQSGGRLLTIRLSITDNLGYVILSWQAATAWDQPGSDTILWEG